jgi:hypothetical protein
MKEYIHDFLTDPLYYITLLMSAILMGILFTSMIISICNSI